MEPGERKSGGGGEAGEGGEGRGVCKRSKVSRVSGEKGEEKSMVRGVKREVNWEEEEEVEMEKEKDGKRGGTWKREKMQKEED